jgi:hypothetical protein
MDPTSGRRNLNRKSGVYTKLFIYVETWCLWTETVIWFRAGTGGGSCECGYKPLAGLREMWGVLGQLLK